MFDDFAVVLGSAKRGDPVAVATLWRSLNQQLVRFLWVRVGGAAEDVASETWLSVAQHLREFDGGEVQFRAWLFTIARRRAVDWTRRVASRPLSDTDDSALVGVPGGDDPAEEVIEDFGTRAAVRLVSRLPDQQAEVLLLRVIAGLDVARVANIVGKRPGTVRMLQHRALQQLRAMLDAERSGEDVTR